MPANKDEMNNMQLIKSTEAEIAKVQKILSTARSLLASNFDDLDSFEEIQDYESAKEVLSEIVKLEDQIVQMLELLQQANALLSKLYEIEFNEIINQKEEEK
jgi:Mg2+ and Co2+ transporter CorA